MFVMTLASHASDGAAESVRVVTHQGAIVGRHGAVVDRQGVTADHQGATIDHQGTTIDHQGAATDPQGATVEMELQIAKKALVVRGVDHGGHRS
jgi:hypothetical protein